MTLSADIQQMSKMLANLESWLDDAVAFATEKEIEPDVLLDQRLSPDMFTLVRQVQAATDAIKFAAARLADVEAPSFPDEEKTMAEVRERIAKAKAFVDGVDAAAIDAGGDRKLKLPFLPEDKRVRAADYFRGFAQPNFYFHLVTAYGILRHSGVRLGKRAYIGAFTLVDPD